MLYNTTATEAKGDGQLLQGLTIKDVKSGETRDLPVNGLFYAIGHEPATSLVKGQLELDEDGYIKTGASAQAALSIALTFRAVPGTAQTSVKGVFAAGDVQDKVFRQAITSAGTGCVAALEAERLLAEEEVHDAEGSPHVPEPGYLGGSANANAA